MQLFDQWKRREFITLLGGAAAARGRSRLRMQQLENYPVIGFLDLGSSQTILKLSIRGAAFRQGGRRPRVITWSRMVTIELPFSE